MAVAADPAFGLEPSLSEVRELVRDHNVVPLRTTFIDDVETPVSALLKLRGRTPEYPAFLLESAERGQVVGRYSFIGAPPRTLLAYRRGPAGRPPADAAGAGGRHLQRPIRDPPAVRGRRTAVFP